MAYPVEIIAAEGEQYTAWASTNRPNHPLGTRMRFADGRIYRFVQNGGSTLVVGDVLQNRANDANHVTQTSTANAAGVRSPVQTLGNTAAAVNLYAEGYMGIVTTPGGGELYVIDNHAAVAGSGVITLNLAAGHAIRTALTASSKYSLYANPFKSVIQLPASESGVPVGIAVKALTSGQYGWIQTAGLAMVLASGTLIIGDRAVNLGAGDAGPAADALQPEIGIVAEVGNTWGAVKLTLD